MEYKDYYQVLGLDRSVSQDQIKPAYRKLARKYHPDVSKEPDAEERFKELNEAYEALKDPEKRAAYDQLGANWQSGQEFRPPPNWDQGFEFHGGGYTQADTEHFSDFFESLFGRGYGAGASARGGNFRSGGQAHIKGEDTHAKIAIDLRDTYHGATRTLTLKHTVLGVDGRPQLQNRTLSVKIPQGICAGQQIRLGGQGEPGMGSGDAGDLYLEVTFNAHPLFHVDDKTVYVHVPITPWEAALGAKVRVPTPKGAVDMKIPPNSANGSKLRVKGYGIPAREPGDLFVVLQVTLPEALSDKEKAAYEAFAASFQQFNPRADLGVE
jgi:curved DNA-binding protein